MRIPRRLVALVAAFLLLLAPPVVAAAMGAAPHAHGATAHGGHDPHDGHGDAADHDEDRALGCQIACAALQLLPVVTASPPIAVARSSPDGAVGRRPGRALAPEPPPPRRA